MIFATPWALAAMAGLPLLWWLLRVTPPNPRTETFPALRLLLGLRAAEETPAHTPWWLLALRMLAATLAIVALAGPVLDANTDLPGDGPLLLTIDNGWAAAPGWQKRLQAANNALDRAARAGREAALLATAPDEAGAPPTPTPPMPVADLRTRLAALRPMPWPVDRAAAAETLRGWHQPRASVLYIADGAADPGFETFARALTAIGPVTEICCDSTPVRVLLPPASEPEGLVARLVQMPLPVATSAGVLAQTGDGRTVARADIAIPAGASKGQASIPLPSELRNTLTRLVLEGPPSAGSVVLLDERWRRRPVGLLAADQTSADAPFAGDLYYLHRALAPYGEVRSGALQTLLSRDLAVLILADVPLPDGAERDALTKWVEKGGLLIRFAGPRMAGAESDGLHPVPLLGGDRQLGGALSWNAPAGLASFPTNSPFAGLTVPGEVKINRQMLAEPGAGLPEHTWAALTDGTPLVTQAALGAGRVVLFHATANADWSNLPLSGLFVDMLRRLTSLSAGVAGRADSTLLAPVETLDGYGTLSPPPRAATALAADAFAVTPVSPAHPPGLYGPESGRQALNLGATGTELTPAPTIPGARLQSLTGAPTEKPLGPPLLAAAIVLLLADWVIAMGLRGLLRSRAAAVGAMLILAMAAPAWAAPLDNPAISTRLGYIVSGDGQADEIAKSGLAALSDFVNRKTSATLAPPDAIEPGRTDLSVYPLLYWPIVAGAPALTAHQATALNDYMSRGGIILIDTRGSGSGAGFAPGTEETFRRIAQSLTIPVLAPLSTEHVLSRSFYLLHDFPGRFTGDPVWAQRDQDRANDSVSPVIIGGNDWAAAWAADAAGHNPYAVIPGGPRQRTMAYRFGVNLVVYALTGNYKGDQVHVPAILQRLGQ